MNMHQGKSGVLLGELMKKYPELDICKASIEQAYQVMVAVYRNEGKALLCGNGGSAADCDHIVGELMKGFMLRRSLKDIDRQRYIAAYSEEGNTIVDQLQGALPAVSLC